MWMKIITKDTLTTINLLLFIQFTKMKTICTHKTKKGGISYILLDMTTITKINSCRIKRATQWAQNLSLAMILTNTLTKMTSFYNRLIRKHFLPLERIMNLSKGLQGHNILGMKSWQNWQLKCRWLLAILKSCLKLHSRIKKTKNSWSIVSYQKWS